MSGDTCALRVCRFPASNSSSTCQLHQVQNQCQTIFGICNGGMFFSVFFLPSGIWGSDWAVKIGCVEWGITLVACCYSNLFSLFPSDTNQPDSVLSLHRNIGVTLAKRELRYTIPLAAWMLRQISWKACILIIYQYPSALELRLRLWDLNREGWGWYAQRSLGIPGQLEQKYWSYAIQYPVDGGNPTPADMENLPGLLWLQLRMFIWTGAGFL